MRAMWSETEEMFLAQILAAIVAARDEGDDADDGPAEAASLRVAGRVCCVPHSADAFNDDTVYATELAAWLRRAFLPVAGGNATVRAVLATPAAATDDGTPIIWEVEVPVAGSSASGDLAPSTPLSVALDWAGVVETAHDDAAARSIELELLQLLASWAIEAAPKPSLFGAPDDSWEEDHNSVYSYRRSRDGVSGWTQEMGTISVNNQEHLGTFTIAGKSLPRINCSVAMLVSRRK